MNIQIVLLHGLGSHPITLKPLQIYLSSHGYRNINSIKYNPDKSDFESVLEEVDQKLKDVIDKDKEIIVVGQSMGGVVGNNLHRKGWKVKKGIYVGSPLHGAKFIKTVKNWVPWIILNLFKSPAWDFLENKSRDSIPPHDYTTISMGWWDTEFDGRVWKEETVLSQDKHIHLEGEDHCLIFAKPRLWKIIYCHVSKEL